jgi:acyl-CoA oxidase
LLIVSLFCDFLQAIAVGKVRAVEGAITLCFALKQEVGSYALMAGSGFEQLDFLQCCKFAEGDSRILMQKMARDIVRSQKPATELEKQALNRLQVL